MNDYSEKFYVYYLVGDGWMEDIMQSLISSLSGLLLFF